MSTRQILIAGYYGRRNAGDEAILQGMLTSLRVHCSDASFVVISADPDATSRSHGVRAVDWADTETMLSEIERSSLVIVGGGGLFHDTWGFDDTTFLSNRRGGISEFGSPLIWAYLRSKPCMLYGVGVGPLKQKNSREAVRALFDIADIVVVRDVYSMDTLQEIGFDPQRVNMACDPAFTAPKMVVSNFLQMPDEIPRPLLGVSVRPWAFSGDQAKWEAAIAEALNQYLESHEGTVVFVPMQDGDLDVENDTLICARIRDMVRNPERVFPLNQPIEPLDRMTVFHHCDLVLGMRLHSLVAAIRSGVPCVALSYDSKVRALMERVKMSDYVLSLEDINATVVCGTLDAAIDHGKEISESLNQFSKKLEAEAASIAEHAQLLLNRGSLRRDNRLMLVSKIIEDRQSRLFRTTLEITEVRERLQAAQSQFVALKEESEEKDRSYRSKLDEIEREKSQIQEALEHAEDERQQLELARGELRDRLRNAEGDLHTLQKRMREFEHEHETAITNERNLRDLYRQEKSEWDKIKASRGWKLLHVAWRSVWRMRARFWRVLNIFTAFFRYLRVSIIAIAKGAFRFLPIWLRGHFLAARMHRHEFIDRSQVVLYTDDEGLFPEYQPRQPLRHGKLHPVDFSLIVTVYNEADSVESWIKTLESQSRLPDEVVIVDGGSVDGTIEFLQRYANTSSLNFQLYVEDGANIARGRNIGIERATHDVIVVTDFGSTLSEDFLSKIVRPFELHPDTQVVAGWFEPVTSTRFGNCAKHELVPRLRDVEPQTFLPSARSMAFRRDAWRDVGGYPEWLTLTGDDTYFAMELKRKCQHWAFVPKAVVYWHAPETPGGFWRKLVSWSEGDGESSLFGDRYVRNMAITSLITLVSILVCAGILAAFFLTTALPVVLVTAFVLILLGHFSIALLSRSGGKSSFFFGFVGQWARSIGFLQGIRRRPRVSNRRFADIEGVVFILAGIPLDDSGGGSRGAQIAREFMKRNFLVVYIFKFSKAESKDLKLNIWHPKLLHLSTADMDWSAFLWQYGKLLEAHPVLAIVEFPLEDFIPYLDSIKQYGGKVIYDLIDDWRTTLGGNWYSREIERVICQKADELTATAQNLVERLQLDYPRKVHLLPNAVDLDLFDHRKNYPRPPDLPLSDPAIIYVGALWGEWFDWNLIAGIASRFPSAAITVIGDYRGNGMESAPNIKFLGLKDQRALPAYLAHADIAIVPWKICPITEATSPLKVYEYLAMHLPVIAPNIAPLEEIPHIFCAANELEFFDLIRRCQREKNVDAELDVFLAQNSWEARVNSILDLIRGRPDQC